MDKQKLERFINKYNLSGACESVLFKAKNNGLIVRSISEDKNVLCEVNALNMGFEDGEYPVYDTTKLKSLLGVLDSEISIIPKKTNTNVTGIVFSDKMTEVTFVLADASTIPSVPDLKKAPDFELTLLLDDVFISKYMKAKSAMSEIETFTVMSDGKTNKANVVLGHASYNTNRVKMAVDTKEKKEINPISFSASYLREILSANKESRSGELQISSKGLAKISFSVDEITSVYYLIQIDTRE